MPARRSSVEASKARVDGAAPARGPSPDDLFTAAVSVGRTGVTVGIEPAEGVEVEGFGVAVVGLGGHGGGVPRELQALLAGLRGGSRRSSPKRRRSE